MEISWNFWVTDGPRRRSGGVGVVDRARVPEPAPVAVAEVYAPAMIGGVVEEVDQGAPTPYYFLSVGSSPFF